MRQYGNINVGWKQGDQPAGIHYEEHLRAKFEFAFAHNTRNWTMLSGK